jgi:ABC-2 type transport system ATP-binding protein
LVIMDEPTNALDPTMRGELLVQVKRARERGQTVLFSSHVLSEVEQVCDRVAVLQKGKLVHLQMMAELRAGRLIRARFKGEPGPLPDLDGLHVRERKGDLLVLEYGEALPELLAWLGRQPLVDLRVEPLGLTAVYHRFHGAEQ